MRTVLFLVLGLLSGCDRLDATLPALSLEKRALAEPLRLPSSTETRKREAEQRKTLAEKLSRLRQRLALPPLPTDLPSCGGHAPATAAGTKLATVVVDARQQSKSLLPRRVTERLESEDVVELTQAAEQLEGRSPEDLARLEQAMASWDKRRYVGILYVTEYAGPALILRVGEHKRTWMAGVLRSKLALLDTGDGRLLCGVDLYASNDTKDAPVRSRQQAETRSRLERALAGELLRVAQSELERSGFELIANATVVAPGNP